MDRGLGADRVGVDAVLAVDDVAVEGVLDVTACGCGARARRRAGMFVSLSVNSGRAAGRGVEDARAEPVVDRDRRQRLDRRVVGDEADEAAAASGPA